MISAPRKKPLFLIKPLILFALLFVCSCANIVMPSGGPIDQQPPRFLKSEPPPSTGGFTGQKLVLRFDEFIQLKDPATKITISPPLKTPPEYRVRGKNLIVEFPETLRPGVTYSIDFGDCIQDITESNPFNNYRFVFSTGDQIDSLILTGRIYNAFTTQAEKDIQVMLYRETYDSVPYKSSPDFIAKSRSDGTFAFSNLPSGSYKIFALRDMNGNLMYDPFAESIGFSDSLVIPFPMPQPDTATRDTLHKAPAGRPVIRETMIPLFDETDPAQRLLKSSGNQTGRFTMAFRWPVEKLEYRVLKNPPSGNWQLDEYSKNRDTVTCWLYDPNRDTVWAELSDRGRVIDTLEVAMHRLSDTLKAGSKKPGKGGESTETAFRLTVAVNAGGNTPLDLNVPLSLRFSHPLVSPDPNLVILQEIIDSTGFPVQFARSFTDPGINRNLILESHWKNKTHYRLIIPKGAFRDLYGLTNDSLQLDFITRDIEEYGVLKINLKVDSTLSEEKSQLVFQLLNDKDAVITEKKVDGLDVLLFDYLHEGSYKARLIFDDHQNGKWDTGSYLQKQQPERILYYPGIMKIRKNWDTEIDWNIH